MKIFFLTFIMVAGINCNLQSNPAKYVFRNVSGYWMLEIRLPQKRMERVLLKKNKNPNQFSAQDYKREVLDYIRQTTHLYFNNNSLQLGNALLKESEGQLNIQFFVNNLPMQPNELVFKLAALSEFHDQRNELNIKMDSCNADIVLSKLNDFTTKATFTAKGVVLEVPGNASFKAQVLIVFFVLSFLGLVVVYQDKLFDYLTHKKGQAVT